MIRYISLKGRINRSEFFIVTIVFNILIVLNYFLFETSSAILYSVSIALIFLYLVQCAKRYHDIDKWGINGFVWWIIPIINLFYFFQLCFKKGTEGVNKYGNPSNFSMFKKKEKNKIVEGIEGDTFRKGLNHIDFQKEIKGMNKYGTPSSYITTESERNQKEQTDLYYLGFNSETHNKYSIKQYQNLRLDQWLVENNDLVNEEQPIAKVKYLGRIYEITSPENGIIELRFAPNTITGIPTQEEDILFAIYPNKEKQIEGHISEFKPVENTEYTDYFLPQYHFSKVEKWFVNEGDFVNKGDTILIIKSACKNNSVSGEVEHLIFAPTSGIVEVLASNDLSRIDEEKPIFSITITTMED